MQDFCTLYNIQPIPCFSAFFYGRLHLEYKIIIAVSILSLPYIRAYTCSSAKNLIFHDTTAPHRPHDSHYINGKLQRFFS